MAPNSLLDWLSTNRLKIEGILVTLSLAGFLLKYGRMKGGDEAFIITTSTLAVFYFLTAHTIYETNVYWALIAWKVIGMASAICVTGITFGVMHWTGATDMLRIGLLSVCASGLILFFNSVRLAQRAHSPVLLRALLLSAASALVMYDVHT